MAWLDAIIAACLIPLGVWILLSGLDDLVLDFACGLHWWRNKFGTRKFTTPTEDDLRDIPHRRIAIFTPLWHEHRVIERMVEYNLSANKYDAYDFFIGVYPNDLATVEAVRQVEKRYRNVHLAMVAHDGPTSKADNLNWIYQRMLLYEEEHNCCFDVIITHDAEDLIHPEALRWINYYARDYDMIQIPVLALPTPAWQMTHGVYCDDFAEYQLKDMRARQVLGAFIPSNGVGTGFSRASLEDLASASANRIFEPTCLTEDYENGLRLYKLRARQCFVPIRKVEGSFVATREYFPQRFRAAVKQRTRWVTGIALQSWERNGWKGSLPVVYWFWRDRKGLIGSPVSLVSNWILAYGAATWGWSAVQGQSWGLEQALSGPFAPVLLWSTLFLNIWRTGVRMWCVSRIYGWAFASLVPIRVLWSNCINALATCSAVKRFLKAKFRQEPLVWLKTEHAYPNRGALLEEKRRLGDILAGSLYLDRAVMEAALEQRPPGMRMGEFLVREGLLSESDLYEALSLQQRIPLEQVNPNEVKTNVARSLPVALAAKWQVLPYKVAMGNIFVASPALPTEEMQSELKNHVSLEIRFHLVTPSNFERLREKFLDAESTMGDKK